MMNQNRRKFFSVLCSGLAAGTVYPSLLSLKADDPLPPERRTYPFALALASYTTREFGLDETIAMTVRVGLKHIGLKSFHLPLNATDAMCQEAAAKIKAAGLDFYSAGVIYMNKPEEADQAFHYARACGIRIIVGVPAVDLLPYVEKLVKQYDLTLAIHNHGPGDNVYPTVPGIYEKISGLDKRIGICMDIGHVVRAGRDPITDFNQCFDRIYEMHIKDEDKASADSEPIEMGRGVIAIPALFKEVIRRGYRGMLAFEYEKDPKDPLPGLAESVGYVHGVLDTLA